MSNNLPLVSGPSLPIGGAFPLRTNLNVKDTAVSRVIVVIAVLPLQAAERAPSQANTSSEDQPGPSGASEPAAPEPDNMEVRGSRFSKSADERQLMLKQRKEELLQQARRCGATVTHCIHVSFCPPVLTLLRSAVEAPKPSVLWATENPKYFV